MKCKRISTNLISLAFLTVSVALAVAGQERYTLKVPNGLAFSEFRGYEAWQVVSISQDGNLIAAILANPVMIKAYLAGVPGNGILSQQRGSPQACAPNCAPRENAIISERPN